jgi:hypothetical protein
MLAQVSDPYYDALVWQAPRAHQQGEKKDDSKVVASTSKADNDDDDDQPNGSSRRGSSATLNPAADSTSHRLTNEWIAMSLRWWSARKMINEKYVAVVFECLSLFFTALLLCMLISCSLAAWYFHSAVTPTDLDDHHDKSTKHQLTHQSMAANLPLVAVTVSIISLICAVLFYLNAGLVLSLQQKDQTMLLNSVLLLRERFPLVTREDESRYASNVDRLIARMNEQVRRPVCHHYCDMHEG